MVRGLYWRWVLANASAEFVGLTSTLAMAAGTFAVNDRVTVLVALSMALGVAVLGAAVEGLAVGTAQWLVLRRALPLLPWRSWALATAAGALVAWLLGMLPSTLLSAAGAAQAATSGAASTPSAAEPSLALQLLLAAGMGAVLGPVLGVPQWLVLRRFVERAGWWVLANVMAWMAGMPMVFLATGLIQPGFSAPAIAGLVALGCLAAGTVVGAVHGAWLVWLLSPLMNPSSKSPVRQG